MRVFCQKFLKSHADLQAGLFFLFLAGTLSFGRAFSIIHFKTPWMPVFITEIFLALSVPFVALHLWEFLKLPKNFLAAFAVFFLLGCLYFAGGLLKGNLFALRDIVLFVYALFCPITFMILKNRRRAVLLLSTILVANLVGLLVGRCLLLEVYPSDALKGFISTTKTFNLGLYYGLSIVFMVSFWHELRSRIGRLVVLALVSINLYMIVVFGVRTVWVAVFVLFFYLFVALRKKMGVFILYLIPIFFIVSVVCCYADFGFEKGAMRFERISRKAGSVFAFLKQPDSDILVAEGADKEFQIGFDNIVWRKKVWGRTISFGMESPVFGKGFGLYPPYEIWGHKQLPRGIGVDSKVVPAHNHLSTIFYKMGIVGLGLFLLLNGYVFIYGLRTVRQCEDRFMKCFLTGALGAFVYWHTMALAFDVIDSPSRSIFLWIIMGMIFAGARMKQDQGLN